MKAEAVDRAKKAAENAQQAEQRITSPRDDGAAPPEPSLREKLQSIVAEIDNTCEDPERETQASLEYWKEKQRHWSGVLNRLKPIVAAIVTAADEAQSHAEAAKDALARIDNPCSKAYQEAEVASRTAAAAAESARQEKEKALATLERARRAEHNATENVKRQEEMAKKRGR